ncbi:transporter [Sphingobium sp. EM0848]|uniref:thiolase C-terminal domain-containing protein n=1 Tax=Sphingobium sp. EM0848 TaxID=2743473 RepID=UPI00159C9281|nr:transporter [Sphingobium sp. EM0848]
MTSPLRGSVAIVGVGETPYYKRGTSPDSEQKLTLRAIVAACEDAGIDPCDVDGFASYADDANAGFTLMRGLGTREMRWSSMVWGGGGGGALGAVGQAAAAIHSGQAEVVAVYRTLAEQASGRLQDAVAHYDMGDQYTRNLIASPAQICGLRTERLLHRGVPRRALEALVRAQYYHASRNPRAQAFGRTLDHEAYAAARPIVDPFGLYDCSRENDISVAAILVSAERARDFAKAPVYLLGAEQGGITGEGWENDADYSSGGFEPIARRLWRATGYGPGDVDVAQIYDNFSGPAVAAIISHGLCSIEEAAEMLTYDNLIADGGRLPINTSGGLIAEGNAHGMGLVVEAVRQLRGESSNPVTDARLCLVTGGPSTPLLSSALFGTPETL